MSSLLHNLENNDAILLMYLSDELPAEDRTEVEHLLERDPTMRQALEQLRAAQDETWSHLERLDAQDAALPSRAVMARRVMRAVRRQMIEEQAAAKQEEEPVQRPGWWAYGLGSAAAAVLLFIIWWGAQPPAAIHIGGGGMLIPDPDRSFRAFGEVAPIFMDEEHIGEPIRRAEREYQALARFTDEPFFEFADLLEELY